MTSKEQILDTLRRILSEDIGIKGDYRLDSSLLAGGVMDSMDWISFLTIIEDKFGIEISPDDANKYSIAIPNNFVRYLSERLR